MNENMMNLQYIEDLDTEHLNTRVKLKETVLSLNEDKGERSSTSEDMVQEVEKIYEGLSLKELPKHLKYAFLEAERSKLVIIVADLTENKEQKLIEILKQHKETIAWSVEDLKGISPSIGMHKILLAKNAKT